MLCASDGLPQFHWDTSLSFASDSDPNSNTEQPINNNLRMSSDSSGITKIPPRTGREQDQVPVILCIVGRLFRQVHGPMRLPKQALNCIEEGSIRFSSTATQNIR